jgi:hypothetical protein
MHGDFACFFSEQAFQRLSNIFNLLGLLENKILDDSEINTYS